MRARASIFIRRDPDSVFAKVLDFASHQSWRAEVVSTRIPPGDLKSGAVIFQQVSVRGKQATIELEITEITPPARIAFRTRGPYRGKGDFSMRPEADGTRMSMTVSIELNGVIELAEEKIREGFESSARENLARLKSQMEAK